MLFLLFADTWKLACDLAASYPSCSPCGWSLCLLPEQTCKLTLTALCNRNFSQLGCDGGGNLQKHCDLISSFFIYFFHQDIDFDLTNLANILDIPGLRYVILVPSFAVWFKISD